MGVGPRERLSTSSDLAHILCRRHSLVVDQIFKEVEKIGIERSLLGSSHETEDGPGGIRPFEEVPGSASNLYCGNRLACAADWACATEGSNPNHDFICTWTTGRVAGKDIICHVGDDI